MQSTPWTLKREGDVSTLVLDDGKANALGTDELRELDALLMSVGRSDVGALIVTGRAGYFSAGMNLKLVPQLTPDGVGELHRTMGKALLTFFTLPVPTVAAISGHAMGAGALLALGADVRLFAEGTYRLALNEVPGGLALPAFGVEIARAAFSPERLVPAVLFGKPYSPAEAVTAGLGEAVLPLERLPAAARERAQSLAQLSRTAYGTTKERLRGALARSALSALEYEAQALVSALSAR